MKSILLGLGITTLATVGFGSVFNVATNGSDANNGSLAAPFKTIQKAANIMVAGDTCSIHAGIYRETVRPANSGVVGKPLVFTAYGNGAVVVHGGTPVTGWTQYSGNPNIYKAAIANPVKDVFVNGQYMLLARHPNMPCDPVKGFDLQHPRLGTANPPAGVDYTGVIMLTNDVHGWRTRVSYPNAFVLLTNTVPQGGWLMGVLGLLDSPGEWCWKNGTLYLWAPGGVNPATLLVEAKVRDVGFDLSSRNYVVVSNLTVLAATVNLNQANQCVLDNCRALYVSSTFNQAAFNTRSGDCYAPMTTNLAGKGILVNGTNNVIRNCEIAHSWGNCVSLLGLSNTVYNCEIYDAGWQEWVCATIALNGGGHVIRQNTLHDTTSSGLIFSCKFDMVPPAAPFLITSNEIYNIGQATTDNAGMYCFSTDGNGSVISFNWVHDNFNGYSTKHGGSGIYLDDYSRNFVVHHNVVWNMTNGPSAKGIFLNNPKATTHPPNGHQVYNNTMWNCLKSINSPDHDWNGTKGRPYWVNTKVYNNILLQSETFGAAAVGNNYSGANAMFVNPAGKDFRLTAGSPCVNAGKVIAGITDGYVGSAPDIGAYEYGGINWQPGVRKALPRPELP